MAEAFSPKPSFHQKYRGFISLGEMTAILGLVVGALTTTDFVTAIVLLSSAFVVGAISIITYPNWGAAKKSLCTIFVFLIFTLLATFIYWRHSENVSAPLLAVQIEELKSLNNFIDGNQEIPNQNTEDRIRKLFDFPDMIEYNLLDIERRLVPARFPANRLVELGEYFSGSVMRVDGGFVTVTNEGRNQVAVIHYGDISWVYESKKYLAARKILSDFKLSTTLPESIKTLISELDDATDKNVALFVPLMNDLYHQNQEFVLGDQDGKSQYSQYATNTYWKRVAPLAPIVEKIKKETRQYLGT